MRQFGGRGACLGGRGGHLLDDRRHRCRRRQLAHRANLCSRHDVACGFAVTRCPLAAITAVAVARTATTFIPFTAHAGFGMRVFFNTRHDALGVRFGRSLDRIGAPRDIAVAALAATALATLAAFATRFTFFTRRTLVAFGGQGSCLLRIAVQFA